MSLAMEASEEPPELPPPEGFKPLVGFKFFPPGGVYLLLFFWFLDNATDVLQILTFALHGDIGFALSVGFFVAMSVFTLAFVLIIYEADSIQRGPMLCGVLTAPFRAAYDTAERGTASQIWAWIMRIEQQIEAPGTGLVAPYGMVLVPNLSLFQALTAFYGLYASSKAISTGQMEKWSVKEPAALSAARPKLFSALQLWLLLASFGELSLFAVVSRVLHPSIPILFYILAANINIRTEEKEKDGLCCHSVLFVGDMIFGMHNNPTGLRERGKDGRTGPGWPAAVFLLVRLSVLVCLCFLELPQGLVPLGSLCRPMGRSILDQEFLQPLRASFELATSCGHEAMAQQLCDVPDAQGAKSRGSMTFNALILAAAMLCVPVHGLVTLMQLGFNSHYRAGTLDEELEKELEQKKGEIEKWAEARLDRLYPQRVERRLMQNSGLDLGQF